MTTACSQDFVQDTSLVVRYHAHPVDAPQNRGISYEAEGKPGQIRPLPQESFAATPGRIAVWVSRR